MKRIFKAIALFFRSNTPREIQYERLVNEQIELINMVREARKDAQMKIEVVKLRSRMLKEEDIPLTDEEKKVLDEAKPKPPE